MTCKSWQGTRWPSHASFHSTSPWDQPPMLLVVGNGLAKIPADAHVHWCWWGREGAPYEFHVDIQTCECGEQEVEEQLAMMASRDVHIDEFPEGGLAFKKYCPQKYGCFPMNSMICKIYIWVLQYFQYEHVHVYDPEYFNCELNSFSLTQGFDICKSLLDLGVSLMAYINSRCPFMHLK